MEEVKGLKQLNAKKIAFVGGGAMAEAIIKGILGGGLVKPEAIFVGNRTQKRCDYLNEKYGINAMTDNAQAVADADLVIFAVKPQVAPVALTSELIAAMKPSAWVLSIMGSVSIEQLHAYAPGFAVIRTMPNTPLACGAGMTAICCDAAVTEAMRADAAAIFSSCGEVEFVDEKAIEAITAISGCGPGYCFVIIDALADAGVRAGLPRALAIKLAAQTLAGSGKLCIESGLHPAQLRDQVTSPGGTTIAGIHALENHGVRGAFYDAVQAVLARSKELQG
ncbi:MAG: pyrroline-5-carboxylate reductase [Phascolarctobacterium sp.]|nr:pyrroline-5-carboxylate reductase [Phascolarctobacterium sp.]